MKLAGGMGMYMGLADLATKQVGDTWLPIETEVRNYVNGWGEVWLRGVRIGTLRPGGKNGKFLRSADDPPSVVPTMAPQPVATSVAPTPVPQIAPAPSPVVNTVAQQPAQIPVSIPTVQTGSTSGGTTQPYVTSLVEGTSSAPAIMPADTGTGTTADSSTSMNQWIGIAALGIGGYALAKMLGFKSRL